MEPRLLAMLRNLNLNQNQMHEILDEAKRHFAPEPNEKLDRILADVRAEYLRASKKFGAFNSTHEGYAVILEELDEMWDEIKANEPGKASMESVQVAAMATRFVVDLG